MVSAISEVFYEPLAIEFCRKNLERNRTTISRENFISQATFIGIFLTAPRQTARILVAQDVNWLREWR